MLRGRPEAQTGTSPGNTGAGLETTATTEFGFPAPNQPFDERPAGTLFYQGKTSFFLPYHLLQRMHYELDKVTLVYATDLVELAGHGLHSLYVKLAWQKVGTIVEENERYAALAESGLTVSHIERIPRSRKSEESATDLE